VGIIGDLEKRGLVTRERSTEDRRRNMLVLSDDGKAMLDSLFAEVNGIEAQIRDELGTKDMAQLAQLLDRAIEAMGQTKR